jgi:hypothetical protein
MSDRVKNLTLSIVGSVKIDSRWRKRLFTCNLDSLEPISRLLSWNLNVVGRYADFARREITKRYGNVTITIDDDSSYYELVQPQISALDNQDPEPMVFFWMEDHWFLCPHVNLLLYLLDKFQQSEAEILTVTHLVTSWHRKHVHKLITDKHLYKEYFVDLSSQGELWKRWPRAYLTGMPAIYKRSIATEILEFNNPILENSKHPGGYELPPERAVEFLRRRSFIEMIPTFHVFREVFEKVEPGDRGISLKDALKILELRGEGHL